MAVRFRSLADGDDVAFKWESSLDKILTAGNYAVEIEHYGADVGLPIEGCGTEHSIVGTLVVTDSGALDNKRGDRVMGQVLTFTLRESKETSIYTRTYAGREWGEWCSLARTGMYDEITNADELYSTINSLVSTTKELEDNLVYGIKQVVDADKVQISTTNGDGSVKDTLEISAVTTKKAGVMTAADKTKLNNDIPYPQEAGTMVTSADKKYIYRGSGDTDVVAGLYWQAWQKTVDLRVKKWGMSTNDEVGVLSMPAATSEKAGVMTAEDKKKLDDNVVALVAETARAQSAEAAAIEQGRKLALRDLFVAAGALYNNTGADIIRTAPWGESVTHKDGHYYLNGLGDITEKEMVNIYNESNYYVLSENIACFFFQSKIRTNLCKKGTGWSENIPCVTKSILAFYNSKMEVALIVNPSWPSDDVYCFQAGDISSMFDFCTSLKRVVGVINVTASTSGLKSAFSRCPALLSVKIKGLNQNIILKDSPLVEKDCIMYMIENANVSTPITITLHADAYARLSEDADIIALLETQPLVSLVSA